MLNEILKIAANVLDCKDACLTNDITVKFVVYAWTPSSHLTFIIFHVTVIVSNKLYVERSITIILPSMSFSAHYGLDVR